MTRPVWRKSSHSGTEQSVCVEVADLNPTIGIRDSKDPEGPHLSLSASAFSTLLTRVKRDKI